MKLKLAILGILALCAVARAGGPITTGPGITTTCTVQDAVLQWQTGTSTWACSSATSITGTGTTNTLPKFTGSDVLGNSLATDTGTLFTIGESTVITGQLTGGPASGSFDILAGSATNGNITMRPFGASGGLYLNYGATASNGGVHVYNGGITTEVFTIASSGAVTTAGTFTTTKSFTNASGINDEIYLQDTALATSGDGLAIHLTQGNAAGTYNTRIAMVNTGTSPGFLNPKLAFYIQNVSTTGVGSLTNEFEITNAGIHTVGTSTLDGAVTAGSTLTSTSTTELGSNGSATKIDGNLIMQQAGTDYIYSSLSLSSGNQGIELNAAGTGGIQFNTGAGGFTNSGTGGLALMPGGSSTTSVWSVSGVGRQDFGSSGAISYTGLTNRGVLNYDTGSGNLVLAAQNSGGTSHVLIATSSSANAATQVDVANAGVTVTPQLTASGGFVSTAGSTSLGVTTVSGATLTEGGGTTTIHVTDKDGTARPTLSTCGTGPSIAGNDASGTVTTGTGATACTITFNTAWASNVGCVLKAQGAADPTSITVSTTALTINGAAASTKYFFICRDH